jgi:Protein of unknown function (DUF4011)/AAA domain
MILYLCLGFLNWTPQDGVGPYRAPLILIPVQLERKSVRSGFKIALHEDEARFNPTLLQMLKQDFDLSMAEFAGELSQDASGIDLKEIWTSVRRHVKHIRGWEVTEQVALATLSFTKYLMWKDLIDREDLLKCNRVVRHLIDTPTHTCEGGSGGFVSPNTIDQVIEPADLFTPLSADSSQLAGHHRDAAGRRLCPIRATWNRQEPDDRQCNHQLSRTRQDGPLCVAKDRRARSRPPPHAGNRPRQLLVRLSWHYRSRHESLIAFSNAKYYRGELVTFPSPVTRDTAVRYVNVEGGVYERGAAKVNRKEAEAVATEVVRRLKTSSHSIGVVTVNGEQQKLIENLLDQARRADPELDRHFDKTQTPEPLLIKNIENVQGDERDVIIFSVAVGPDKTGRVTAQVSSLNGEGGHRRRPW